MPSVEASPVREFVSVRSVRQSQWLSRTERQVLLACLSFLAILAVSGLIRSELSDSLRPTRPPQTAASQSATNNALYTGSILFVPREGDACWQRFLDNKTGRFWDNGPVSCEATAAESLMLQPGRYTSVGRLDAIRKGFLGQGK
jgi:hypothetical protein